MLKCVQESEGRLGQYGNVVSELCCPSRLCEWSEVRSAVLCSVKARSFLGKGRFLHYRLLKESRDQVNT